VLVAAEAGMALLLWWIARRTADGRAPYRDDTDANSWDLRSVIRASEETWVAAHRAQVPFLRVSALGFLVAAAVTLVAVLAAGPAALGVMTAALLGACGWAIVWFVVGHVVGRAAARRVYAAAARARRGRG
jgi:hypothetical protein